MSLKLLDVLTQEEVILTPKPTVATNRLDGNGNLVTCTACLPSLNALSLQQK